MFFFILEVQINGWNHDSDISFHIELEEPPSEDDVEELPNDHEVMETNDNSSTGE